MIVYYKYVIKKSISNSIVNVKYTLSNFLFMKHLQFRSNLKHHQDIICVT